MLKLIMSNLHLDLRKTLFKTTVDIRVNGYWVLAIIALVLIGYYK
jgi:hypothetical protein